MDTITRIAPPNQCIQNVHYDSPIGATNLGVGYDHRPDQTK